MLELQLRGDYIELDKLLKALGLVESGGRGRVLIAAGEVRVDGRVELRKTAKIRAGQVVGFDGQQVTVVGSAAGGGAPP